MKTVNQFPALISELQALEASGLVTIKVVNTTSTGYGIGSLEGALQKQVEIQTVHELEDDGEGEKISIAKKRILFTIIALDNDRTIQRKIQICKERINDILNPKPEVNPAIELRASDSLFSALTGYFGEEYRDYIDEEIEDDEDDSKKNPGLDESSENDSTGLQDEPNTSGDN